MRDAEHKFAAEGVHSVTASGDVRCSDNADILLHPASTLKLLTAYVALRNLGHSALGNMVLVHEEDRYEGRKAPKFQLGAGISVEDLFYLLALSSHNGAARILARYAGELATGARAGKAYGAFLGMMRSQVSEWGWKGAQIECAAGLAPGSRLTALWLCELMLRLAETEPWLLSVLGSSSRRVEISHATCDSIVVEHTISGAQRESLDGFVAGKTGTIAGTYGSLVVLSKSQRGKLLSTAVLRAVPAEARFADAAVILAGCR